MLQIIFKNSNNQLSVMMPTNEFMATLTGTEEEKLMHLSNKYLHTGTKY